MPLFGRRKFLQAALATPALLNTATLAAQESAEPYSKGRHKMTKTILAMGQSNAEGMWAGGVWGIPANVKAWNSHPNTDALTGLGTAFVHPQTFGYYPFNIDNGVNSGNNMMAHACRYLANAFQEDINLLLVSRRGTPISYWCNEAGVTGTMYARMKAVLAAAGVTKVDAFLWHQGEANNPAPGVYAASFAGLLSHLTADGYIDTDTPIVIGETIIQMPGINAVLHSIADADPRIGIADISCFPQAPDGHFSGTSLVRAGLEYSRELMKLAGPFYRAPAAFENVYVTGTSGAAVYLPNNTFVKIKMKGENGRKSLFNADGAFVADRTGVWEFQGRGCAYSPHVSLSLLDDTGAYLQSLGQFVTASSSFKPVIGGSAVMALGEGDKIFMGLYQGSGAAVSIAAPEASLFNRLTVKYLGAE
jgi:hypothetical protein